MKLVRFSASFLLCILAVSCNARDIVAGKVIDKANSPNDTVVAIVTSSNWGATVPQVFRVYLEKSESMEPEEILRADNLKGLHISWINKDTLSIKMDCGRIFMYRNFYDVIDQKSGSLLQRITVTLDVGALCSDS